MKYEIKQLVKIGIPEDVAMFSVCVKYNKTYLVNDYIDETKQEQELLKEEVNRFIELKHTLNELKDEPLE